MPRGPSQTAILREPPSAQYLSSGRVLTHRGGVVNSGDHEVATRERLIGIAGGDLQCALRRRCCVSALWRTAPLPGE
jgi:hypothetical protein